jgi:cytochrome c-type biogenesis protein CcmH
MFSIDSVGALVKRLKRVSLLFVAVASVWLLSFGTISLAQEPDYDRINEVAEQMNCPTCVGINLADCRTQTCEQWRGQIGDLVEEGYSDQEVLDFFATRYGNQVLLEPPKSGSTLLLWILPVAAIIGGGSWLIYTLRRWNKTKAPPATAEEPDTRSKPPPAEVSADYLSQVESDLEN